MNAVRAGRSPAAFFSGAVLDNGVAGLAVVPRGRLVAVAELRVVLVAVLLLLLASAVGQLIMLLMSLQWLLQPLNDH